MQFCLFVEFLKLTREFNFSELCPTLGILLEVLEVILLSPLVLVGQATQEEAIV